MASAVMSERYHQGGKSFLSLEWSLRISAGMEVLGHRSKRVGVVYVASEGANGVRKRVTAWRRTNPGVDCAFEMIGQAPDLRKGDDIEALIAELHGAADELAGRDQTLGLVIIDTLAASMPGGNENDGADMRPAARKQRLRSIGSPTAAASSAEPTIVATIAWLPSANWTAGRLEI